MIAIVETIGMDGITYYEEDGSVAKHYITKVFIFRSSVVVLMLMHSFIKLLRLRHQNNKYRGKK